MATLDGRTVMALGGSGQVGAPIVRALLEAGARVVVPSRGPDRARDVLGSDDGLHVVQGETGDHDAAVALRAALADEGWSPTDVVASIGGWWQGDRVADIDPQEWARVLGFGLGAHFHAANTFLPVLLAAEGPSTYTLVNGGGAKAPVPGSGAVCVSAAAQLMLGRVLAQEHRDDGDVTVTTLVLDTPVLTRDRPEGRNAWLRGEDVAKVVAALVAGHPSGDVVTLEDRGAPDRFLAV